ncbi:MAG: AbrB/MazE/SpoVT family DNA-binding domain-containing protein [Candidatus Sulfotelmatobacter sp.]
MRRTVVNARGQVTIPAELRALLEIKPGTRVTWFEDKGRLMLAPMTVREKAEKIMRRYRNTLRALAK